MFTKTLQAVAICAVLTGCAQHPSQNRYDWTDVGQATTVTFGKILSMRQIEITGRNTGTGALVAGTVGMGAGSYIGNGTGNLLGALAGAMVGAAIGAAAEQAAADHGGIEYVIHIDKGDTITIVQHANDEDEKLRIGQRVMVQTSGMYQRVMPAPDGHAKPAKVKKLATAQDHHKALI